MGTFAEKQSLMIIHNFSNQGEQTSVFLFPFAANKRKFAIFVF
jgi:hypothetical protein